MDFINDGRRNTKLTDLLKDFKLYSPISASVRFAMRSLGHGGSSMVLCLSSTLRLQRDTRCCQPGIH
eukprot:2881247-Amphidinium_carterae.1